MADNTENAANEPVPSADQPDKKTDDFSEELPQDPGSEAPLNPATAPKADAPRPTPTAAEAKPKNQGYPSRVTTAIARAAGAAAVIALAFLSGVFITPWTMPPSADQKFGAEIAALQSDLRSLNTATGRLRTNAGQMAQQIKDLSNNTARITLETQNQQANATLRALRDDVQNLQTAFGALNAVNTTPSAPAVALSELASTLDAQQTRINALQKAIDDLISRDKHSTEQAQNQHQSRELTHLLAALEDALRDNRPYRQILIKISALSDLAIPPALELGADQGGVDLEQLKQQFPSAARRALAASDPAEPANFSAARLGAFLKRQLNARSLAPQTGASTDAILSRAEAALASGDLSAALAEIADLTPAPAAQMAAWKALAEQKLARQNALLSLRRLIEG
ncbi:hypothetical protein N9W63_00025 [Paracoccaceae bacterium]|nr:hypothetical protein [Paracoccaceae bacterium]